MNVATHTVDPDVAREKLRALRKQLHRRADAEYRALEQCYVAAEEGHAVIGLAQVFDAAPRDSKGRPQFAIARSDRKQVKVSQGWRHGMVFDSDFGWKTGRRIRNQQVEVPSSHPVEAVNGYALVPIVPGEIVNKIRGQSNLRFFFTLWEVERWADTPIRANADRDPYLLRHIEGDLYAVIAEWDLTEIERLVMGARRNGRNKALTQT